VSDLQWLFPLRRGGEQFSSRLLVFPYAAAGPTALRPLLTRLPASVQILGVALPGRERRFEESPEITLAELVRGVTGDLGALGGPPTVLFGHSLGAALAVALAVAAPEICSGVIVSGRVPNGAGLGDLRAMADEQIASFLAAVGNTSGHLLADPFWRARLVRLFRQDTELDVDASRAAGSGTLRAPILALGGTADPYVRPGDLRAWAGRTGGPCRVEVFPGEHFFLLDPANHAPIAAVLTEFLTSGMRVTVAAPGHPTSPEPRR
jgi:pyochelin biosynthesis protein PchC